MDQKKTQITKMAEMKARDISKHQKDTKLGRKKTERNLMKLLWKCLLLPDGIQVAGDGFLA